MSSKCANFVINCLLFAISLIFFLVLLEIALQIFPYLGYKGKFELSNVPGGARTGIMSTLNDRHYYQRLRSASGLGYEWIPCSAPEINSYGMIGKEYRLIKSKSTYRILVLGDSITEPDWYVRSIEEKLNRNSRLKYKFELWNGAVGGYQIWQYSNYLKYKGLRYNPDMVIIGFCLSDLDSAVLITYKDNKGFMGMFYRGGKLPTIIPINSLLLKYSYLYRFLYMSSDRLLTRSSLYPPNNEEDDSIVCLKNIRDICQNNKIILLGVIFPYLKSIQEYTKTEMQDYKRLLNGLKEFNIDYIDLHQIFPTEREKLITLRRWENFNAGDFIVHDFVHPSQRGHEIAAEAIYNYLIEKYFR